jgi:hypothetical protein
MPLQADGSPPLLPRTPERNFRRSRHVAFVEFVHLAGGGKANGWLHHAANYAEHMHTTTIALPQGSSAIPPGHDHELLFSASPLVSPSIPVSTDTYPA